VVGTFPTTFLFFDGYTVLAAAAAVIGDGGGTFAHCIWDLEPVHVGALFGRALSDNNTQQSLADEPCCADNAAAGTLLVLFSQRQRRSLLVSLLWGCQG
jgi:hypothetical protein